MAWGYGAVGKRMGETDLKSGGFAEEVSTENTDKNEWENNNLNLSRVEVNGKRDKDLGFARSRSE